jgi:AraC-like DNA-binding protein
MAMAKGLLQQNKPVSLIANEVGYENSSSLAKVFKKHFGITPKKWMQEYLKSR